MKRYGGEGRLRKACLKRVCVGGSAGGSPAAGASAAGQNLSTPGGGSNSNDAVIVLSSPVKAAGSNVPQQRSGSGVGQSSSSNPSTPRSFAGPSTSRVGGGVVAGAGKPPAKFSMPQPQFRKPTTTAAGSNNRDKSPGSCLLDFHILLLKDFQPDKHKFYRHVPPSS